MVKAALLAWALMGLSVAQAGALKSTSLRQNLMELTESAQASLDIRLARLDDAGLQKSVIGLAQKHVVVRLILDMDDKSNRLAAKKIIASGAQLRWSPGPPCRYLIADHRQAFLGHFDGKTSSLDAGPGDCALVAEPGAVADLSRDFNQAWAKAALSLPQGTVLKDQLEALPDPREKEPHLQTERRKN